MYVRKKAVKSWGFGRKRARERDVSRGIKPFSVRWPLTLKLLPFLASTCMPAGRNNKGFLGKTGFLQKINTNNICVGVCVRERGRGECEYWSKCCYYDFLFFIGFVSPEDNFRSDSAFVTDLAEVMKSFSLSWQDVFLSHFLVSRKTHTFCLSLNLGCSKHGLQISLCRWPTISFREVRL